jgi:predicted  nucleic acid-binding Zn-ribbon protein
MASNMVNRYLDREGILEEETAAVVKAEETAGLNRHNQVLKEELALLMESHSELSKEFENLKKELDDIRSGKGFMRLLLAVAKQQDGMPEVFRQVSGKKFDVALPSELDE